MWGTFGAILRQAPLILGAADTLLARSRRSSAAAADLEAVRQRLTELEQHQLATAALAKELAEQAQAIAAAMQADAAKTRQVFILAIVAVVLAIAAIAIAIVR